MPYQVPSGINADRGVAVIVRAASLDWTPSPQPGVDRRFLERQGAEVAEATSIVRYAPNSSFPGHVHHKGEEFLVLEGVFSDEQGDFAAGSYVRNPPASRHAPFSRGGCVIFVKLRQMLDDELGATVCLAGHQSAAITIVPGVSRTLLFAKPGAEEVGIEQLAPGTQWRSRDQLGGEEILVLEGTLDYGSLPCPALTWLRIPAGLEASISTRAGCRYWVKRGHLGLVEKCG